MPKVKVVEESVGEVNIDQISGELFCKMARYQPICVFDIFYTNHDSGRAIVPSVFPS